METCCVHALCALGFMHFHAALWLNSLCILWQVRVQGQAVCHTAAQHCAAGGYSGFTAV